MLRMNFLNFGKYTTIGTSPLGGGHFIQQSNSLDTLPRLSLSLLIQELSMPLISSSEDCYGLLCVLVPARVPLSPLSRSALASWLVPSSAFPLSSCIQTQPCPPSAQAPLARRLPRLSSRLYWLVGWKASDCACASLAR